MTDLGLMKNFGVRNDEVRKEQQQAIETWLCDYADS